MVDFSLGENIADAKANVTYEASNFPRYRIEYPCQSTSSCTYYTTTLRPGSYFMRICGANGGVCSSCQVTEAKEKDFPYAGGCTSGYIALRTSTKFYIHLGGHGTENSLALKIAKGGYNGGGDTNEDDDHFGTSGGGASDIRAEVNDVFHRVIVAGGGGGGDDMLSTSITGNDGKGGSGGGLVAQSWYTSTSTLEKSYFANQTYGFTFGNGESANNVKSNHPNGSLYTQYSNDLGGAGGGWFGGFASQYSAYGAGGGSSFILTKSAVIPSGQIEYRSNDYLTLKDKQEYAFAKNRKYSFVHPTLERGVWFGNGFAEITVLSSTCFASSKRSSSFSFTAMFCIILVK